MSELFHVSSNPHVRSHDTTSKIMLIVILSLLPASIFGIWNFGVQAFSTILISVVTCVLTEYLYEKCMHQKITVRDLSATVTGLLIALNLPANVPWWIPVIGGVFAILFVKQLFGGIGQNFMNPALAARCFLLISFTGRMTNFVYDGVSAATPLASLKAGESVNTMDMLLGNTAGTIGETSLIAIIAGAILMIIFEVIDLRIPASYLLSFAFFVLFFGGRGFDRDFLTAQMCGGGLMLGAFFMATDYVTSPITKTGQIVYGCILGILTGIFRIFGNSAEGVSYAIIFANLLVPLIEKATLPTAFGKGGKKHE